MYVDIMLHHPYLLEAICTINIAAVHSFAIKCRVIFNLKTVCKSPKPLVLIQKSCFFVLKII